MFAVYMMYAIYMTNKTDLYVKSSLPPLYQLLSCDYFVHFILSLQFIHTILILTPTPQSCHDRRVFVDSFSCPLSLSSLLLSLYPSFFLSWERLYEGPLILFFTDLFSTNVESLYLSVVLPCKLYPTNAQKRNWKFHTVKNSLLDDQALAKSYQSVLDTAAKTYMLNTYRFWADWLFRTLNHF